MTIANDIFDRPAAARMLNARSLVYSFFFLSGMPALIYQLAWQRVLFRVFGTSMDSVTVIVTAFMLGLGIGSLAGSWLAQRRPISPLLIVVGIELAIGLFGTFSLSLFAHVDPLVQGMTLTGRALACIALIFVPTALMGATLPLLIDHMVQRSGNVGFSIGSLYRINALGAVVGCGICALLLFPFLGLQTAILVAVGFNLLVAATATAAFFTDRRETNLGDIRRNAAARPLWISPQLAQILVLASGFISLSYEIFFLRLTSLMTATSPTALTMVLGCFLLGIAGGAQAASAWCEKKEAELSPSLSRLLIMNALAGAIILPLLTAGYFLGDSMNVLPALGAFVVAQSLGAVFPLVAQLSVPANETAGRQAGYLYLANIIGSAAGCLVTGFVLFDMLGLRAMAVILSLLGAALALFLIWNFGQGASRRAIWALLAATLIFIAFQGPLTRRVMDTMLYKLYTPMQSPLIRVLENRYGIVAESKIGVVFGGGIYDGRFNTDPIHDSNGIMRALSLSLVHPAPHDVFMIGLATGSWAQVVAANPEVRELTIVEINPAYLELVRQRSEVRSILTNPKVHIIIDDAARWLRRNPAMHYDVIVANATYHFRSNASNLLSMEFNALAASHLKKGGIYQYNTTDSLRVQRTGCESFRHGYRLMNNMLVSNDPISFDSTRWRRNLLATSVDGHRLFDLRRVPDSRTMAHYMTVAASADQAVPQPALQPMESCASLLERTAGLAVVTDDNMGTEWRVPLGLDSLRE